MNNNSIKNYVSEKKLKKVIKSIEQANGLPNELYINPDYLKYMPMIH